MRGRRASLAPPGTSRSRWFVRSWFPLLVLCWVSCVLVWFGLSPQVCLMRMV
ncbi:hypothetical protein NPIL_431391, partial [Nephila pilipes]